MRVIEGETLDEVYVRSLAYVLEQGCEVAPRGIRTREVFPLLLRIDDPRARLLFVNGRVINPALAVAETLWVLSGDDGPWIYEFNSRLRDLANDGRLAGAYGPRLRAFGGVVDQLTRARDLLARDPATRQAVLQLYDPASVVDGHLDVPCTLSFRYLLRQGRLHAFCTMRSQDAWLGLPYDVFFGTTLQELLAGWVGAELGAYHHAVDSFHLYETDVARARAVCLGAPPPRMSPLSIAWTRHDHAIRAAIDGVENCDGLASFAAVISSYKHWRSASFTTARDLVTGADIALQSALNRWYDHVLLGRKIVKPANSASSG